MHFVKVEISVLQTFSVPGGDGTKINSCNRIDDSVFSVMAGQQEGLFPACQACWVSDVFFCSLFRQDYFLRNTCCWQTAEAEDPKHCFNSVRYR